MIKLAYISCFILLLQRLPLFYPFFHSVVRHIEWLPSKNQNSLYLPVLVIQWFEKSVKKLKAQSFKFEAMIK